MKWSSWSCGSLGGIGVGALLSVVVACNNDDQQTFQFGNGFGPPGDDGNISVRVTFEGGGAGRVSSNEPAVDIDCTNSCSDTFADAGGGGVFRLIANPDSGHVFAGWRNCPAAFLNECELSWGPTETSASFSVFVNFESVEGNACHEAFSSAPAYLPCEGAGPGECKFYTRLNDVTSCIEVCAGGGGVCRQSLQDSDDGCSSSEAGICADVVGDRVCVCTQP